jgi:hypothetical protein
VLVPKTLKRLAAVIKNHLMPYVQNTRGIQLLAHEERKVEARVVMANGATLMLGVLESTATVLSVKQLITQQSGIHIGKQQIYLAEDTQTEGDLELQNSELLHQALERQPSPNDYVYNDGLALLECVLIVATLDPDPIIAQLVIATSPSQIQSCLRTIIEGLHGALLCKETLMAATKKTTGDYWLKLHSTCKHNMTDTTYTENGCSVNCGRWAEVEAKLFMLVQFWPREELAANAGPRPCWPSWYEDLKLGPGG